ncbi:glycosyltransferase family 4 protein [Microbacterium thalli]|uniref:glycosyltransferase family 4 protein n=1 Tax=Microbacterium thalli TaxID=3027921 RepID=UPI0023658146|nr:glycosyltransferase [Microbacterium thalli]MDD7930459.1 glycosyltransferase [Microbacterium thalli]
MASRRPLAVAYDCLFPFTTGGGERQYAAFAREIVKLGYDVDYLTARQWDDDEKLPESFAVIPVTGRLSLYSRDGVRRIPAALRFAAGLFRALVSRRRRYSAVIVSGLPIFNVFAARLALLGSGTRVVVDYLEVWPRHQWVEYSGTVTGTIAWVLQRAAIAMTPLATCHSQLSATRLRSEGLRSMPVVSPGLIDATVDAGPVASASQPPYVLYVGRHIPDKRVETLPAAVAAARQHVAGLRLVVLGRGPSGDAVRAAVAESHGDEWTAFPGFVDEERLAELMHGALCVVNPSRREGYGLVVVEANAHGTPVVLVADPGNAATELVEAGVNGVVADSASAGDLSSAIRAVADGGDELRRNARAWYDSAIENRTIRRTVEGILEALEPPGRIARTTKEDTP